MTIHQTRPIYYVACDGFCCGEAGPMKDTAAGACAAAQADGYQVKGDCAYCPRCLGAGAGVVLTASKPLGEEFP